MTRTGLLILTVILLMFVSVAADMVNAQEVPDTSQTASQSQESPVKGKGESIPHVIQDSMPDISWQITAGKIVWSFILFFIVLIVIKYLTLFLETVAERWANLRLLIKRLIPIVRIIGWATAIYIIIFNIIAPPIETLIAVTASAGIAIGFASQDILKNIFGGIMILFDRPFQVGDKINIGPHYGEVIQIGLRSVRIVTPDDSIVSIPNSDIVNQAVSNANTGQFYCQVVAEFYLPPDVDLVQLRAIAVRAAAVSRYVYINKPISVIIKNEVHQGRSLLKVRLKAYVFDLRYEFPFMSEMTELVVSELLRRKLITAEDLAFVKRRA